VKLVFTNRAARQIDEALHYLAELSPQGASRVEARLQSVTKLLLLHPFAGRATSRAGVRRFVLSPYPYLLDYRVRDDTIIVMRFRHGARATIDPPTIP